MSINLETTGILSARMTGILSVTNTMVAMSE